MAEKNFLLRTATLAKFNLVMGENDLHISLCKPFAISLALYLWINLSGLCLSVNTHMHATVLFPSGKSVNFQVPFFFSAFIS